MLVLKRANQGCTVLLEAPLHLFGFDDGHHPLEGVRRRSLPLAILEQAELFRHVLRKNAHVLIPVPSTDKSQQSDGKYVGQCVFAASLYTWILNGDENLSNRSQ